MRFLFGRSSNGTSTLVAWMHVCMCAISSHVCPSLSCRLRDMIDHSKEWARQRGLIQKNEVHGREEWKIPTDREFSFANETSQSATARGSMAVED